MADDLKHLGIYSTKRITYIGTGMTRRKNVQKRYWSVSLDDEGKVVIQALNQNLIPSGAKRTVGDEEFHERFEFEPDIFAVGVAEGGRLKPLWRSSGDEAAPEDVSGSEDDENILLDIPTDSSLFEEPEEAGEAGEEEAGPGASDGEQRLFRTEAPDIPPELADEDVFQIELGKDEAGAALMRELGAEDMEDQEVDEDDIPTQRVLAEPAPLPEPEPEYEVRGSADGMTEEELFDVLGPDKSGPEVVMTARERRLMEIEKNARADFGLGISYLQQGQTKLARKIFEDLAVIDGDFSKRHKYMFNDFGIGLRKSKMLDVALKNYLRVVELAPDDENVYHNIARIYYEKGEMDKAQDYLEKALRINPRLSEAEQFLAFIRKKGRKSSGLRFKI